MNGMAKSHDSDAEAPFDEPPTQPPYAPDPRLIDVLERGSRTTVEEARERLRRDAREQRN